MFKGQLCLNQYTQNNILTCNQYENNYQGILHIFFGAVSLKFQMHVTLAEHLNLGQPTFQVPKSRM